MSVLFASGLAVLLSAGACTNGGGSGDSGSAAGERRPKTISQPVVKGLAVAPETERVDVAVPSFSNPTHVTNPLFPVSKQESVLLLGHVDGKPFRTEVTLLPDTRIIRWQGQQVETLVSQYNAFLDGRIEEVAYDFYAQADDGSVWYFGEDVFDFQDGVILGTQGTWTAGKDGPAAMIMPADPRVGDVYRTENIPGVAFEEVTVKAVGETLDGPVGPIDGGFLAEELHMDGTTEDKLFAPDYGEFFTGGGGDVEALALAVPTDALGGPVPAELDILQNGAAGIFDAARSGRWQAASTEAENMAAAWETYRADEVPRMIEPRLTNTMEVLAHAVATRDAARARQASIDAARWSLDLQLRYRAPVQIDVSRFRLWTSQLLVDAAAHDAAAVNGDIFALDYVRDRILHALGRGVVTRVDTQLEALQEEMRANDLAAAADKARRLRRIVADSSAPPFDSNQSG